MVSSREALIVQIQINGNVEQIIQAGIASGQFQSAEDALNAMSQAWVERQTKTAASELPRLPDKIDIEQLAREQGVKPFVPGRQLPNVWPEDESIDDFIAFLKELHITTNIFLQKITHGKNDGTSRC